MGIFASSQGVISEQPDELTTAKAKIFALEQKIRLYELAKVMPEKASLYARANGIELKFADASPRTALEAIKARKQPDPWRPSVDDFDLLPDV